VKTAAAVVQDLINRTQALQPPLTGQQAQGLLSKLNQALTSINSGQFSSACGKLGDYVTQVQNYISNGTLTSAQGQPLINSANHVRNTIGCTSLPCS
jgi:Flp pilus assembly CpaF family ATPase